MRSLLRVLIASLLVTTVSAPAVWADPGPARHAGVALRGTGSHAAAQRALQRAERAIEPAPNELRRGVQQRTRSDATAVLRELALRLGALGPKDRRRARAILARPSDHRDPYGFSYSRDSRPVMKSCTPRLCIHWVKRGNDAPPQGDSNHDGRRDWVQVSQKVVTHVYKTEVGRLGYRAPKGDTSSRDYGTRGNPNPKLDVYLANTGNRGIYGYCATDDPHITRASSNYRYGDASSYCVLDNDYAEFPANKPADNLRVTAAHELFHAVQFAYDFGEDLWLMEGTAVWMEDKVYDSINDNYQFLSRSALTRPQHPTDLGWNGYEYGSWLLWRYLTEHAARHGIRPGSTLIKAEWKRADAAPSGPNDYSLQALRRILKRHGTSVAKQFAHYSAANAAPDGYYSEGAGYRKAVGRPPAARTYTLAGGERRAASVVLDHLASKYVKLSPGKHLSPSARLRVKVDLPARYKGSAATLVMRFKSGATRLRPFDLNGRGNGSKWASFDRHSLASAVLSLANGSARIPEGSCGKGYRPVSCYGRPSDDGLYFRFAAKVFQ